MLAVLIFHAVDHLFQYFLPSGVKINFWTQHKQYICLYQTHHLAPEA